MLLPCLTLHLLVSISNTDHPAPAFVNSTLCPLTRPTVPSESVWLSTVLPYLERTYKLLLGSEDAKWIFESVFTALEEKTAAKAA